MTHVSYFYTLIHMITCKLLYTLIRWHNSYTCQVTCLLIYYILEWNDIIVTPAKWHDNIYKLFLYNKTLKNMSIIIYINEVSNIEFHMSNLHGITLCVTHVINVK